MTVLDALIEMIPLILSSAGISGSLLAAIMTFAIKRARSDAENKREERLKLEILRLEGDEKMSALLFAMLRNARGVENERELDEAEKAYTEYLENCSRLKNEIISNHTFI